MMSNLVEGQKTQHSSGSEIGKEAGEGNRKKLNGASEMGVKDFAPASSAAQ